MIFFFFLIFIEIAWACTSTSQEIKSLPGYIGPWLSSKLVTGFVCVNETMGSHYFFWLSMAETTTDPSVPLTFWFQGGPGAAGELGLLYEMGPIQLLTNGSVQARTFGNWNKQMHMVFIDQPSGVGFSYADNELDYQLNSDSRAADRNLVFVQRFLSEVWPQHRSSFVSKPPINFMGESYGGVYVPMLTANAVVKDPGLPIQRVLLGNPVFKCEAEALRANTGDAYELFNILFWRGLVAYDDWLQWKAIGCNVEPMPGTPRKTSPACITLLKKVSSLEYQGKDFSGDNLYFNPCTSNASLSFVETPGSCNFNYFNLMSNWLGRPDVLAAIGAPHGYTNAKNFHYTQDGGAMAQYYAQFLGSIRALIYSGTLDVFTVPQLVTMPCLTNLMGSKTISPWRPWTVNGHTAGHFQKFQLFDFATLKGAGHEAPAFQPLTSFIMIQRWLKNDTL